MYDGDRDDGDWQPKLSVHIGERKRFKIAVRPLLYLLLLSHLRNLHRPGSSIMMEMKASAILLAVFVVAVGAFMVDEGMLPERIPPPPPPAPSPKIWTTNVIIIVAVGIGSFIATVIGICCTYWIWRHPWIPPVDSIPPAAAVIDMTDDAEDECTTYYSPQDVVGIGQETLANEGIVPAETIVPTQ